MGDPFLRAALEEARRSLSEGGIPIGSVVVHRGTIAGSGHNRRVQKASAILHAEMDALENAGRRSAAFYRECTLYTTLSPCAMCSGAIVLYRIPRVVIGEDRSFMGEEAWLVSHHVEVEVVQDPACVDLMRASAREPRNRSARLRVVPPDHASLTRSFVRVAGSASKDVGAPGRRAWGPRTEANAAVRRADFTAPGPQEQAACG